MQIGQHLPFVLWQQVGTLVYTAVAVVIYNTPQQRLRLRRGSARRGPEETALKQGKSPTSSTSTSSVTRTYNQLTEIRPHR